MKFREGYFIVALCAVTAVYAAEPNVEFAGVLTNEGHTKLALTDKASGTTRWVEPGEVFFGYTVARYDSEHDAVFLRKNGQETRLGLIASKSPTTPAPASTSSVATTAAATAAASPSTEAAANAIRANLRMLVAAARKVQGERGGGTVTYADLVGPDKPIRELRPVAGETYSNLSFPATGTTLSVTMADGAPVSTELPPAATPPTAVAATPAAAAAPTEAVTAPAPAAHNVVPPAIPTQAATPAAETATAATAATTSPTGSEPLEPTGRAPTAPTYTTPAGGETWESVSHKTGVPVTKLRELNSSIPSGSSIPQGQTIRLQ